MKAGLRLILFLGCDPEAATEFAFLSQIWQRLRTVSKATCHFSFIFFIFYFLFFFLSLFLVSQVSGQVWNIALFLHELAELSAFLNVEGRGILDFLQNT